MQMDTSNIQAGASAPKKNNMPIIIAVVVVVILLCCCVLAIGGYFAYKANKTVSGLNNSLATAMPGGGWSPTSASAPRCSPPSSQRRPGTGRGYGRCRRWRPKVINMTAAMPS